MRTDEREREALAAGEPSEESKIHEQGLVRRLRPLEPYSSGALSGSAQQQEERYRLHVLDLGNAVSPRRRMPSTSKGAAQSRASPD